MSRTARELHEAAGRIAYSFEMATAAAHRLDAMGDIELATVDRNALIEAFLIHVRKLTLFLEDKANHQYDVRLSDFSVEGPYSVDIDAQLQDQISKRVAHFSHIPVPDDADVMQWPISSMARSLRSAYSLFCDDVETQMPDLANRLRQAEAAPGPGFRKRVNPPAPSSD